MADFNPDPRATRRSYAAGNFELQIDGAPSHAYLKSVDGGYVRAALVDEPIGPDNHRIKHLSTVEIEPFTVEFGLSNANAVLEWIAGSWNKQYSRRNGHIRHANFNEYQTLQYDFQDALITETTFPTLDGLSTEPAYLKVKIQPETVKSANTSGGQLDQRPGAKQKMWLCSGFQLNIDGVDDIEFANKIDSFTIKQGTKKFYTGEDRFPQIEPTKIEFPNISGTIATEYAGGLMKWYDEYIVDGMNDVNAQKSGSIEFLNPQRDDVLFRLNLAEVGLLHLSLVPSQANADSIKRFKFELYVGSMKLDDGKPPGME